mmetsp:Transcript_30329/g.100640  ORF Transcript_30329/g.100640 Transcript_30329/m.100640 type:complete len:591 (+) Transcript_30329:1063-2835(+)
MLRLHRGQQCLHLHDVVHRGQRQQRHHSRRVRLQRTVRGPDEKLGIEHERLELIPLAFAVELHPLLGGIQAVLAGVGADRAVLVVHAEGEALLAIDVQAHEPIDGEESPHRPLVLVTDSPPGARGRAAHVAERRRHDVAVEEIQIQLREDGEVRVEFGERVGGVRDAARHQRDPAPVRLPALQSHPQRRAGRPHVCAPPMCPRPDADEDLAGQRRDRHALDRVAGGGLGLVLHAVGGEALPGPEVELRANFLVGPAAVIGNLEVALGGRELLARGQAQALHARVRRVGDSEDDLVDGVATQQARVAGALHVIFYSKSVRKLVLLEVLLLPGEGEAEAVLESSLAALRPIFRVLRGLLAELRVVEVELGLRRLPGQSPQRQLLAVLGGAVDRDLEPGEEHVLDAEDVGEDPDLHQPQHALYPARAGALLREHAALLLVRLPEKPVELFLGPHRDIQTPLLEALQKQPGLQGVHLLRRHDGLPHVQCLLCHARIVGHLILGVRVAELRVHTRRQVADCVLLRCVRLPVPVAGGRVETHGHRQLAKGRHNLVRHLFPLLVVVATNLEAPGRAERGAHHGEAGGDAVACRHGRR